MPLPNKLEIKQDVSEIQKAHDILCAIILGEVVIGLDETQHKQIQANCEVLCWILGHNHNTSFADNLMSIQLAAYQAGYQLYDSGELKIR